MKQPSYPCSHNFIHTERKCVLSGRKGFTLVELIVVIAITLVLTASVGFAASGLIHRLSLTRSNEYARSLYSAAQNRLSARAVMGTLDEFCQTFTQGSYLPGDGVVCLATAEKLEYPITDSQGQPLTLSAVWPGAENAAPGNPAQYRGTIVGVLLTEADYLAYQSGAELCPQKQAVYDLLTEAMVDTELLRASLCVELSPEAGQIYSVFYCDGAAGFSYAPEDSGGLLSLCNRERETLEARGIGYYGGKTLSAAPGGGADGP